MGLGGDVYFAWTGRDRLRSEKGFHDPVRLRELMETEGVDLLVVSAADDIAYLSNFDSCAAREIQSPVLVVFARNRPDSGYLIFPIYELADYVECVPAKIRPWCYSAGRFRYFEDRAVELNSLESKLEQGVGRLAMQVPCADDPLSALRGVLEEVVARSSAVVALEDGGIPFWMKPRILEMIPGATVIDGELFMRKLRAKKTLREIKLLEMASEINNRAMAVAVAGIRPGVTEVDLARIYSERIWAEGAEVSWAIIKAGTGSALTHAHSTDYALREGDLIRFELGCRYSGYYSDVGRTYTVGCPTAEQAEIYEALRRGFFAAVDALRPGVRAREVFRKGIEAVRTAGFTIYQRGFIGHGCGTFLYDLPLITETSEEEIQAQMVLAVELPYYRLGLGGFQVEAQVVVEDARSRVLGTIPETLETTHD